MCAGADQSVEPLAAHSSSQHSPLSQRNGARQVMCSEEDLKEVLSSVRAKFDPSELEQQLRAKLDQYAAELAEEKKRAQELEQQLADSRALVEALQNANNEVHDFITKQ